MPSDDDYSEAEESGSEEEEDFKDGVDEDDEDQGDSDEEVSGDEDFAAKRKTKPTPPKAQAKKDGLSLPESIPTEISIKCGDKEFVFVRSIKKRTKPVPRAFDVEYRLKKPEDHPDSIAKGGKVLRTGAQVKEFLQQNEISPEEAARFDFSLRYGENGELTEHGRKQMAAGGATRGRGRGKRKGQRLLPKRGKKQRMMSSTGNHPLSKCVQIVFDVMSYREASIFNKPVQAKHAPGYFEKIKEPMDLGTIFGKLKEGSYLTAHQVRKDVTLVWKNCLTYNGSESEITQLAEFLAEQFDLMFDEAIKPPTHLGMKEFKQGPEWIKKKVECYWGDDKEWYAGEIVDYDPEKKNDDGAATPYLIKYNEDDEDEWMDLPAKDVAIIDNWEGLAEQLEPWEGFMQPVRGGAGGRQQRSRTTTKHFTPVTGPAGGTSRGGKRGRQQAAQEAADDDDGMADGAGANEGELSRVDGEKIPSDFICDDGQPCGDVCRCRLLFWCRFKTRKGVVPVAKGGKGGFGGKVERCSYANCPHPNLSSNDRWHFISQHTASGGRDWTELMGQTLCSSCFQQYRGKGTLVRVRDVQG